MSISFSNCLFMCYFDAAAPSYLNIYAFWNPYIFCHFFLSSNCTCLTILYTHLSMHSYSNKIHAFYCTPFFTNPLHPLSKCSIDSTFWLYTLNLDSIFFLTCCNVKSSLGCLFLCCTNKTLSFISKNFVLTTATISH